MQVAHAAQSPPVFGEAAVAGSYAVCRQIVQLQAKNFYYGMRLTPAGCRDCLYAVYAWMRYADDAVDEAPDRASAAAAHRRVCSQTAAAMGGCGPSESFWPAFAHTLSHYPRCIASLVEMLLGLGEDADHRGYETFEELDRYCYQVGGTVGQVCTTLWGLREGESEAEAQRLAAIRGRAFQLVNILRDIGGDAGDGRSYVPRQVLREAGIDAEQLLTWAEPARCKRVVGSLCQRANEHFEASSSLDAMIDPACVGALVAMTGIYKQLLAIIERDPQRTVQVGAGRASISTARKLWIMAGAVLGRGVKHGGA